MLAVFLSFALLLFACKAEQASCILRLNNSGTPIGKATFYTEPGAVQKVLLAVMHPTITEGLHGFHVHAGAVKDFDCGSTGGHYNPDKVDHGGAGGPASSHHVGDFGNVNAHDGMISARINFVVGKPNVTDVPRDHYVDSDRFALTGDRSIVGRAVVLHAGTDDLGKGGDAGSKATGNAGARLACCTLE